MYKSSVIRLNTNNFFPQFFFNLLRGCDIFEYYIIILSQMWHICNKLKKKKKQASDDVNQFSHSLMIQIKWCFA